MSSLKARRANVRPPPLSKADWLDVALQVLVEEGIEAVQVTRLTRSLRVTRGGFYWHFRDRGDLLSALLDDWQHRNTDVMKNALAGATSLTEGILSLFRVWVDDRQFNRHLDQAVRDWARRCEAVNRVVGIEDGERIDVIRAFFSRFGFPEPEAFIRARVIYFTQLSYYALGVEEPMIRRMGYLAAYFRCFTGEEIDTDVAKRLRERLLAEDGER